MFLITGEGKRRICSDQKSRQSQLVPHCQRHRWDTPCPQWPGAGTREPLRVVCGWAGPRAALLWPEALSPLTRTQTNRKTQRVAQNADSTPSSQPLLLRVKPQALAFHLLSKLCSNLLPHPSSLTSSTPASTTARPDKAAAGTLHRSTWNSGRLAKAGLDSFLGTWDWLAQLRTRQISLSLP